MKQCLVVDDSRIIRKVAASIMAEFAFESAEAEDSLGALSACRSAMPDVVLLDWNIPNSNVIDFVRTLRREPGGSKPVIIYCTTENDAGRISEALHAGANDYVLKPYDRPALKETLAAAGLL